MDTAGLNVATESAQPTPPMGANFTSLSSPLSYKSETNKRKIIFSYASSSTLYPCESVSGQSFGLLTTPP